MSGDTLNEEITETSLVEEYSLTYLDEEGEILTETVIETVDITLVEIETITETLIESNEETLVETETITETFIEEVVVGSGGGGNADIFQIMAISSLRI